VLSKLNAVADKYRELEALLSDPAVMADMEKWQRYTREHAALTPIVEAYSAYQQALLTIEEDQGLLAEADAEMKAMLEEEIAEAISFAGLDERVRGETLGLEDFVVLSDCLSKL